MASTPSETQYKIEAALHLVALGSAVNASMRDGWQPHGTPFQDGESRQWCQAMVRFENPAKPGTINLREVGKRK